MPNPDTETYMLLARAVADTLRLAPRSKVIEHLSQIVADVALRHAGDQWIDVDLWDVPVTGTKNEPPAPIPSQLHVETAVIEAVGKGFAVGLGHAVIAQVLRDVAGDLERGELARDPWGPRDSRLIDAREVARRVAEAGGGQLQVHLVTAEAGECLGHAIWVHSVHGSIADAKAAVTELNRLAAAVREASIDEQLAAIERLVTADPDHPAGVPHEVIGPDRQLLVEPGTFYKVESFPLENSWAARNASGNSRSRARPSDQAGVGDVGAEANDCFSEKPRYSTRAVVRRKHRDVEPS